MTDYIRNEQKDVLMNLQTLIDDAYNFKKHVENDLREPDEVSAYPYHLYEHMLCKCANTLASQVSCIARWVARIKNKGR